jgi:single-strand DNA-binding protein
MDLNKVMLIGNVTQDPEIRSTPNGNSVTSFSLATNFFWTDQTGAKQEKAEFHNIVAWRRLAEIIGQYVRKGSKIYIEGRLQTRSWDDPSGIKKYRTEVIAENMIMLDRKGSDSSPKKPSSDYNETPMPTEQPVASSERVDEEEISVEDIPF